MKIYDYKKLTLGKSLKNKYTNLEVSASRYEESLLLNLGPIDLNPKELLTTQFYSKPNSTLQIAVLSSRNGLYYQKIIQYYDDELHRIFDAVQIYNSNLELIFTDYQMDEEYTYYDFIKKGIDKQFNKINLSYFINLEVFTERNWENQ